MSCTSTALTPFGCHERGAVLLVIGLDRGLVRLRKAGHAARGDQRELRAALLGPVAVEGHGQRLRHLACAADGAGELVAEKVDADQVLVLGTRHVVALENQIVELGVERARFVAEGRRALQLLPHAAVGGAQPERAGFGVEQILADEEVEHLAREPGAMGLLARQVGAAGALPLALQGALELAVEEDGRHLDIAHRRHRSAAPAGEHVVDSESPEAQRQDDDDAPCRPRLGGLAHGLQHCGTRRMVEARPGRGRARAAPDNRCRRWRGATWNLPARSQPRAPLAPRRGP